MVIFPVSYTHLDVYKRQHGTNPASAVMAGMKVVVVKNLENGEIDFEDLKAKAELHSENLSAAMITYPSTYGPVSYTHLDVYKRQ